MLCYAARGKRSTVGPGEESRTRTIFLPTRDVFLRERCAFFSAVKRNANREEREQAVEGTTSTFRWQASYVSCVLLWHFKVLSRYDLFSI